MPTIARRITQLMLVAAVTVLPVIVVGCASDPNNSKDIVRQNDLQIIKQSKRDSNMPDLPSDD